MWIIYVVAAFLGGTGLGVWAIVWCVFNIACLAAALYGLVNNNTFGWWWTGTNSQSSTSKALTWIQCKLGKQYLVKKDALPLLLFVFWIGN